MADWLISYRRRIVHRDTSGKLEWSSSEEDRMDLIDVHPVVFVANFAEALMRFTDPVPEGQTPQQGYCEKIEFIRSAVEVPDDLTDDQRRAIKEVYDAEEV